MYRRQVLGASGTAVGLAFVSGCLGAGSDGFRTKGDDESPFDTDPAALLLPEEALHEPLTDGWTAERAGEEAMFSDADAARQYVPYDEEEGFHMETGVVTNGVWFFADVDTARDFYGDHPYREGWGFEEREIAVESIAGSADSPSAFRVVFRDANVVGGLQYDNGHIEADRREKTGLELAVLMHENWRNDESADE